MLCMVEFSCNKKTTKQSKGEFFMRNFTTETYQMKREIVHFANRISAGCNKVQSRFNTDMIYGILASGSCLLTEITDTLKEASQKVNTVERLGRHLNDPIPECIQESYLQAMKRLLPDESLVFVDDSDIVKPFGKKFESLGLVRDGSAQDLTIEKGYHVTEIAALTKNSKQPVSLYSLVHSSAERNYVSANDITYRALDQTISLLDGGATYVFDRGYDMNDLFLFMYKQKQDFIIRLTEKRKLYYKNKWISATALRDTRKGKVKANVMFDGKMTDCYISCVNVRITASRKPLKLILVYGLGETPMMLATNRPVQSKDDAVRVVRAYFSRWRIEEYFRFKKQHFGFENFRVRSITSINSLNQYISYCIGFIAMMEGKDAGSCLKAAILNNANAIRQKVIFLFYRLAKGIAGILSYAKCGVRDWFDPPRPPFRQLSFNLIL
jgi:hypothetical protein